MIVIVVELIVFLVLIAWRVLTIQDVFRNGYQVMATINRLSLYGDFALIDFTYSYQGSRIRSDLPVACGRTVKQLKIGDSITLFINSRHHKRMLIKELFL